VIGGMAGSGKNTTVTAAHHRLMKIPAADTKMRWEIRLIGR
jgi:hypothetical protein